MKRRLTALLAMAATLALGLALARWSPKTPGAELSSSPAPSPAPVTLAFLGSDADPWCAPLYDELEALCRERGWTYISYDCRGSETVQAGQARDLARSGEADVAVLYAVDLRGSEAEWIELLQSGGAKVVTLGRLDAAGAEENTVCRIGVSGEALLTAAADFLLDAGAKQLLLLPDVGEDSRYAAARQVLPARGLTILEETGTWGTVETAGRFAAEALARSPQIDGVVTFSRTGVLGVSAALTDWEGEVRTLCLSGSPALLEEVALGRLDAALTPTVTQAAQALRDALPRVAAGERPGEIPLEVLTVTAQNVDTLEIGY